MEIYKRIIKSAYAVTAPNLPYANIIENKFGRRPKLLFNPLPDGSLKILQETKSLLLKERYLCEVEIIKEYDSPNSFALGKTDFGIVYFPKKFFGYLTNGQSINVTIALQDIERTKYKKNIGPRFIAIYTHKWFINTIINK